MASRLLKQVLVRIVAIALLAFPSLGMFCGPAPAPPEPDDEILYIPTAGPGTAELIVRYGEQEVSSSITVVESSS